ncbi:RhoGAP domain containing protein [Trichomonas vaginalis G3]|uniref:RhoGAP domain containing protein n=1 Tax=Trichomonas vaginalis (strain ATCC PRA-98 / G3) TaxID=412133 RepID=A2FKH8_TRIV3|nr:GTPase activator protein [Trichomonas vaginalis G3]EAX94590.1 RhoGAP domain containing protein [Trichomonas vaginalis G3]KAI5542790.1 GTPase activator protein [Trichomonas vaginalis G3]|eukprot:XP_001307520.1 RhoGAP domain containing protein [Trichomonas vaginalis G3]
MEEEQQEAVQNETPQIPKKGPRVHKRNKDNIKLEKSKEYYSKTTSMGDLINPDKEMYMPGTGIFAPPLPKNFKEYPTFLDFANSRLSEVKKGGMFGKKFSPSEVIICSMDPLKTSLLISNKKIGAQLNELLLTYIKAKADEDGKKALKEIYDLIRKDEELIDETFLQAMRLTNQTPDEFSRKTWQAFMFVCTIFPASKDIKGVVYNYIESRCHDTDPVLQSMAQFTYIRYDARTPSESVLEFDDEAIPLDEIIDNLPNDVFEGNHYSCVSIYEMIWSQSRNERIHYPYPIYLKQITNRMVELGILKTEGCFRLPGSKLAYTKALKELYHNKCEISSLTINDLDSMFKAWFRALTEPLIPTGYFDEFLESVKNEKYIEFAESLPRVNRDTLKFLVGFCKKITAANEYTKMSSLNVAICFSPNIVSPPKSRVLETQRGAEYAKSFLIYLVDHWNTTDIYTD